MTLDETPKRGVGRPAHISVHEEAKISTAEAMPSAVRATETNTREGRRSNANPLADRGKTSKLP